MFEFFFDISGSFLGIPDAGESMGRYRRSRNVVNFHVERRATSILNSLPEDLPKLPGDVFAH